ncbi:MAG: DNA-binding protein WhiA, partial [Clostridia bacterium]|nr:DNA-binding protein WhiA [Clostridia bacterium]
ARLADKNASMQELADRLSISKSCINHRMRKILELAKSLDKD